MRILVLCYEYPPVGGGGGNAAKAIAEQLAARGHEVRVQTAALGWRSQRETSGGVEIWRTGSGRGAPDTCTVPEMGLFLATSFLPALRHLRSWRPHVVHAHFAVPTGVLAWAAHFLTGTPYVLTAHLGDVPGGVPAQTDRLFRWIGPVARRIWSGAAAATAVSSFVQELAQRAYDRPVVRILNGLDLADAPVQPAAADGDVRLIFLGRFNPQKNPVFLVEALAKLRDLPWKLTMIGDGPLRPAVEGAIVQHGLSGRVELTGWLEPPAVQAILRGAQILCMPSTSEGLPVAGIEALKHGLAIVASDIPGVWDILEDGVNGCRVPLGSVEAFARQLGALVADRPRLSAMQQASLERARRFDLGLIAGQYERVLQAAALPVNHAGRPAGGDPA